MYLRATMQGPPRVEKQPADPEGGEEELVDVALRRLPAQLICSVRCAHGNAYPSINGLPTDQCRHRILRGQELELQPRFPNLSNA